MSVNLGASTDPHWDQVVEIAALLWVDGEYATDINPSPTQRFVDLQWAARQAGRILGRRTAISVSSPRGREDPTVTVKVTYAGAGEEASPHTEKRLERALRKILEERVIS